MSDDSIRTADGAEETLRQTIARTNEKLARLRRLLAVRELMAKHPDGLKDLSSTSQSARANRGLALTGSNR